MRKNTKNIKQEKNLSSLDSTMPRLLSITESSIYSGLTVRSINNLIYKNQVPFVHVGRRVYLRRIDLDQLIEKGTRK